MMVRGHKGVVPAGLVDPEVQAEAGALVDRGAKAGRVVVVAIGAVDRAGQGKVKDVDQAVRERIVRRSSCLNSKLIFYRKRKVSNRSRDKLS